MSPGASKLTLAEVKGKLPPASLPKLDEREFSILWTSGWWDGPTSGLLSYHGVQYWFEMIQESEDDESGPWYRRYAVVVLTAEQLALEHQINAEFQLYVRDGKELRPKEQWHHFYDKHGEYCRNPPYGGCEVIAWFERR